MVTSRVARLWCASASLSALALVACARENAPSGAEPAPQAVIVSPGEEFVGPFSSWINVKAPPYNAVGDGIADDAAALQHALDDVGTVPDGPQVVYLPAGRYRIGRTLRWTERIGVSFLGEDPRTTTIVWDGEMSSEPPGSIMMSVDGVAYSRWGRITWDGAGRAAVGVAHRWNHERGLYAPILLEHADEVFQNLEVGLLGGSQAPGYGWNDDTVTIVRARFHGCRKAGIALDSFNALNWFVWDSEFADNARGITNQLGFSVERGAGNFLVYRSVFHRSSVADLSFTSPEYFSFRWNVSVGSRRFLETGNSGNAAPTTLQGNRILDPLDPTGTAVEFAVHGPLVLLDNQMRTGGSGPGVRMTGGLGLAHGRLLSTGNRFTVDTPIDVGLGRARSWDDIVVAGHDIDDTIPPPPVPAPRYDRPVFEVPQASDGATVQAFIDQAAQLRGQRPIVHLPPGHYRVAAPLVVPAGSDVQIVGDGIMSTVLQWTGGLHADLPILDLPAPSRASVRELKLDGGAGDADGIRVATGDAPTSRVLLQEPYCQSARQHCLLAEGLVQTSVEVRSSFFGNLGRSNVRVVGSGVWRSADVTLLGASSFAGWPNDMTTDRVVYEVDNGGRLLVQDAWYEGWNSRVARLTGTGAFTYWAGVNGPYAVSPVAPVFEFEDFRGQATLFGLRFDFCAACSPGEQPARGRILRIGRQLPETEILLHGLVGMYFSRYVVREPRADAGRVAFLDSYDYIPARDPVVAVVPATNATAETAWLERMLEPMRSAVPSRMSDPSPNVTDVRIHRIEVGGTRRAFHVHP